MTERDRILHDIERDIPHGKWAVKVIDRALKYEAEYLKAKRTTTSVKSLEDVDKAHDALMSALKWHDPAQAVIK